MKIIMKKKDYQKPTMRVFELNKRINILTTSSYETTGSGRTSINAMDEEEDL